MTLTICPKFTVDNEDGDELNREQSLLVQIGNEFVKSCSRYYYIWVLLIGFKIHILDSNYWILICVVRQYNEDRVVLLKMSSIYHTESVADANQF
jgi:hypothetical protein